MVPGASSGTAAPPGFGWMGLGVAHSPALPTNTPFPSQRRGLREDLATLRPPAGHHLNHQPGL